MATAFTRLRRILSYTRPYRGRLWIASASLVCAAMLGLVYPAYLGELIDTSFTSGDLASIQRWSFMLLAVFASQAFLIFWRHYLVSWVGERTVADLRVELYSHLLTLSPEFFHGKRSGEVVSRLADDVSKIQRTVSADISIAARNAITLVGGVAVLAYTNLRLSCMILALVPAVVLLGRVVGRKLRRLANASQDAIARANAGLQEGIAGVETVQAFGREDYEVERYSASIDAAFGFAQRRIKAGSWFVALTSFTNFSVIVVLLYAGSMAIVAGELGPGDLTRFILYTMLVANAVEALAGLWTSLQGALGATARVFEILDTKPRICDPPNPRPLRVTDGLVRFEGVSFAYDSRSDNAVDEVDFTIPPGTVCALVGPSGAGKTTLARLLYRLHDPALGTITIDGYDLRSIRLTELRDALAWVTQDPLLFSGTIFDNIRYGRLDATREEILHAARDAHVDEFVQRLPAGYDTWVGERGVHLSGGQRQRVAVARALLRDPKLLVLDEATNALDAESEAFVRRALARLRENRTTLVIAHRLSTIRDADWILVLDRGRIIERGMYAELVAHGGLFTRLVQRQETGLVASRSAPGTSP